MDEHNGESKQSPIQTNNAVVTLKMMYVYSKSCVLLQWKGLPYGECTFETPEAISQAGGQDQLDQYEVKHAGHVICCHRNVGFTHVSHSFDTQ